MARFDPVTFEPLDEPDAFTCDIHGIYLAPRDGRPKPPRAFCPICTGEQIDPSPDARPKVGVSQLDAGTPTRALEQDPDIAELHRRWRHRNRRSPEAEYQLVAISDELRKVNDRIERLDSRTEHSYSSPFGGEVPGEGRVFDSPRSRRPSSYRRLYERRDFLKAERERVLAIERERKAGMIVVEA